jgi:hypothetical protein
MTIKQYGGVFGRNPTFNDVTVEGDLTVDGAVIHTGDLTVDNLNLSGNTISSTDTNGNIILDPNGTGYVLIAAPTNGTIAQLGDTSSRTFLVKQANVGGYDNDTLIIESDSGVGQLQWKNGGGERLRINTGGDVSLLTGNLVIGTSGKGIDFSATAGTGTSELFDDYEEGTWTATLAMTSGSVGYGAQAGKYVKVGNQVTATAWIAISSVSSPSGALSVALPFVTSFSTARTGTYIRNGNLTGVTGQTTGWLNPGTATLYLSQNDNGTGSNLDGSNLQVGTELYISITYIV